MVESDKLNSKQREKLFMKIQENLYSIDFIDSKLTLFKSAYLAMKKIPEPNLSQKPDSNPQEE